MHLRALILILLAVAVLSPPLALASSSCAGMGAECEGPCGSPYNLASPTPTAIGLTPVADLFALLVNPFPTVPPRDLEPPPRSL